MQHWVLEYYHVCSNDDPGLTLTYFMARSNFVLYALVWEKGKTMKVGRFPQLNWYNMTTKGQGHLLNFIQHFQASFAQKPLGRLKPNFMWSLHRMWGMKMCSSVWGPWPYPYMVKNFKNLFLWNQEAEASIFLLIDLREIDFGRKKKKKKKSLKLISR